MFGFGKPKIKVLEDVCENFELVSVRKRVKGHVREHYTLREKSTQNLMKYKVSGVILPVVGDYFVAKVVGENIENDYEFALINKKTGAISERRFKSIKQLDENKFCADLIDGTGLAFYYVNADKVGRLRFSKFLAGNFEHPVWMAAVLNNKTHDAVFVGQDDRLMGRRDENGKFEPYRFAETNPFENRYFAVAKNYIGANAKNTEGPYVLVYSNGEVSAEKFSGYMVDLDEKGEIIGISVTFDGSNYMQVGKSGVITERCWLDLIEQEPANFRYMPTKWFADEAFISKARRTAMNVLEKRLNKIATLEDADVTKFEGIVAEIDNKIKTERENVAEIESAENQKRAEEYKREMKENEVHCAKLAEAYKAAEEEAKRREEERAQQAARRSTISSLLADKSKDKDKD